MNEQGNDTDPKYKLMGIFKTLIDALRRGNNDEITKAANFIPPELWDNPDFQESLREEAGLPWYRRLFSGKKK